MPFAIRGLIEGFYGRPWSWDERVEVMRFCHERGMTHYVYAPKDDPKHRQAWRDPYDDAELTGFRRLLEQGGLGVGFAISPGLSMEYGAADDRAALAAKVDQVVDLGVDLVCLALDDIPFRPGLGDDHAAVAAWLREHLGDRAALILVPTEYVGLRRTPYLAALAAGVPDDVPIAWTGRAVVNDAIPAGDARARADALGGRPPLVWDNYPVNDAVMSDRLFMGPLRGRDPELAGACSGYLANPMVQPRASRLPLASVAAFLRGDDPVASWEQEAGDLRVFAEACDGEEPRRLVAALAAEHGGAGWAGPAAVLARWLEAAAACRAPDLDDGVDAWVDQVHREAAVALDALRAIQASRPVAVVDDDGRGRAAPPDAQAAIVHLFTVAFRRRSLPNGNASAFGPRWAFRPSLGQRADGTWRVLPESIVEDHNALDALVRLAVDWLGDDDEYGPVRVSVDGVEVEVGSDGSFRATPGATVVVQSGNAVSEVSAPGGPPLDDPRLALPS